MKNDKNGKNRTESKQVSKNSKNCKESKGTAVSRRFQECEALDESEQSEGGRARSLPESDQKTQLKKLQNTIPREKP